MSYVRYLNEYQMVVIDPRDGRTERIVCRLHDYRTIPNRPTHERCANCGATFPIDREM